jgi:serine protease
MMRSRLALFVGIAVVAMGTAGAAARQAHRRLLVFAAVMAAAGLALLALAGAGSAEHAASRAAPPSVPGQLIVGFQAGVSRSEEDAALARVGAARVKTWDFIHAALAQVPDTQRDALIKRLELDPRVRYAEPNYVVHADATIPNDPRFGELYGLNNTGQTIQGSPGTADADIDAPEAWEVTTGSSSTVVAVVDTGVDYTHPDLAANIWTNPGENCGSTDPTIVCSQRTDGIDNDGNGYVDDVHGYDFVNHDGDPMDDNTTTYHGTHVSGTVGAVGNNGVGVVGVNWHVKIMALKFLNSSGSGSISDAVTAFGYARTMGAKLTSNSWGGDGYSQALLDAINANGAAGILTVAAAGNSSSDDDSAPPYPAGYATPYVLAVAATDNSDRLASFSSYGRHTVLLGAPGVNILSTMAGNNYHYLSGTSMATPHVSGGAALLLSVFPNLSPLAIEAILGRTDDPKSSLNGFTITGGRLNVSNAVRCTGPKAVFRSPIDGDATGVSQAISVDVLVGYCGSPTAITVTVTANGTNVPLTNQGNGEWTGSYTPLSTRSVTFHLTATAGGGTDTQDAVVSVQSNYTCGSTTYAPIDATSGTNLLLNYDDSYTTIALPFAFTFYGQSQSTITVSTNGFANFGSTAGSAVYANTAIPSTALPNSAIYPFWDNLNLTFTGRVYSRTTGSAPNRTFTIEWYQVAHSGNIGAVTFELNLHETTNTLDFQYVNTNFGDPTYNSGASATSGVENGTGMLGVQNSYNQAVLASGTAVACSPVSSTPSIVTAAAVDGTTGVAYSQTFTGSGGTGPYTWTLDSGAFPPGVTTLTSGTPSATLTGTPTTVGTYSFTLRLTDAASQTTTRSYTVDVRNPVTVTTTSLPAGTAGVAYNSGALAASGGTGTYSWSWSGSTPPWGSINASTGAITGTPTSGGTWTFTVTASDTGNPPRTGSKVLSITVSAMTITTSSPLPVGKVGVAYSQALTVNGGSPPYTWSLPSGSLPPGLILSPSLGTISGTPSKPGGYSFTVQVTDGTNTASKAFTLKISKK